MEQESNQTGQSDQVGQHAVMSVAGFHKHDKRWWKSRWWNGRYFGGWVNKMVLMLSFVPTGRQYGNSHRCVLNYNTPTCTVPRVSLMCGNMSAECWQDQAGFIIPAKLPLCK